MFFAPTIATQGAALSMLPQKLRTRTGEPYIKHLEDEIWELRPLKDRILFVAWVDGSFVLLHHFVKKTQKTPRREIDKAKRELKDIKERGLSDEE